MSRRLVIAASVIVVCAVMLGGVAAGVAAAQASKEPAPAAVRLTAAGGGHYRLDAGPVQVRGSADGAGYHLEMVTAPAGGGTPCCCTYLPCMVRDQP